jgi:hypothetical protein
MEIVFSSRTGLWHREVFASDQYPQNCRTNHQQVGGYDRVSKTVVALVDHLDETQSAEEAADNVQGAVKRIV